MPKDLVGDQNGEWRSGWLSLDEHLETEPARDRQFE
jgi:hypothetical protein